MKKIIGILTGFLLFAATIAGVGATTYENSAYIGSWKALGEEGQADAFLDVDYCDESTIKCRFRTVKGENINEYEIYRAQMNDTTATAKFAATKSSNNWLPEGTCTIELTNERIKLDIVTNSNVRIYSGTFKPQNEGFDPYVSPYNYDVKINVNGQEPQSDLKPFILKDRTYVPLRGVFEAMGIEVNWEDTKTEDENITLHTHKITAKKDGIIVNLRRVDKNSKGFGSWEMSKHAEYGDAIELIDISDIQPVIINDNTYIPLRVVVESFNSYIDWNDAERTVIIDEQAPSVPSVEENTEIPEEVTDEVTEENTEVSKETAEENPEVTQTPDESETTEELPEDITEEEQPDEIQIPEENGNSVEAGNME